MKKTMALVLSVAMLCSTAVIAAPQQEALDYVQQQGIMTGDAEGNLETDRSVTRAEMAKMLVKTLQLSGSVADGFVDVPAAYWGYQDILTAKHAGIINGYEDGTFRPEEPVLYEEAVKIVLAAYGVRADYPIGYMTQAMEQGYLDGIAAVMGENAPRGDIAQLLFNADKLKQEAQEEQERAEAVKQQTQNNAAVIQPGSVVVDSMQESAGGSVSGGSGGGGGGATPVAPGEALIPAPSYSYNDMNAEEYNGQEENIFHTTALNPLSTFSIDVDTASYSNMRRFILQGQYPRAGSIRTEELINYFDYDYPNAEGDEPVSITTEIGTCPWNPQNKLALIGVKGREIDKEERQPSNLVLLIDVSGSMYASNRLPLVKKAMKMLLENLDGRDRISIVTYASGTRVALNGADGNEKETILNVLESLTAGGGTYGEAGIQLAYETAEKNRVDGNNRVILCTDGDFNIGSSSQAELDELISGKRDSGIYLSVLGFGMGNYKDARMETLADKGDGNYAYIDNAKEAKKVLVDDMTKTLFTVADDVKLQVEFNPTYVKEYRLVGYENRLLNSEDFENDEKDAGELGAGHTVTALYEIVPAQDGETADNGLRYQDSISIPSDEWFCVSLRYKDPGAQVSKLMQQAVMPSAAAVTDNFRFAAAVAQFGMLLNQSEYAADATLEQVIEQARGAMGEDTFGLRAEFIQLVGIANYLEKQ